jgi:hypothetical protein
MAAGWSDAAEKAILDSTTVGLERQLYLYLFKYDGYTTGASGNGNKVKMNDDGTITQIAVTDAVLNSTTTLTSATASFSAAHVGMVIDESAGLIPVGTTIASVTNSTTIVMSAAATGSGSSKSVKVNAFSVVTGGGWVPLSVLGNATPGAGDWAAATAGAPTVKNLQVTKSFLATGSGFGDICWLALSTMTPAGWAANAALMVNHGPITTTGGAQTVVPVATSETFQFDASNPIKAQLGDTTDTFA